MEKGQSGLCKGFQQKWTDPELEGTQNLHDCLKHAGPKGNIFLFLTATAQDVSAATWPSVPFLKQDVTGTTKENQFILQILD